MKKNETQKPAVQLPEECPCFCSGNCAGPSQCIYWNPYDRDHNGRQYCSHYDTYYYPHERGGCLSKET